MKTTHPRIRRIILPASMFVAALFGNPIVFISAAVQAQGPALETFATNVGRPQTLTRTPAGDFYVVDTDNRILSLPADGGSGTASVLGMPGFSLRDGAFLPRHFGPLAGHYLVVGGVAFTNTPAHAATMDGTFTITPYATQPGSLWSGAIIPSGFGEYTRGVLIVNQGSGQDLRNGSVDYFAPDGTVGRVADLPDAVAPYGGAMAFGFGAVSGTLLVSDGRSRNLFSVSSNGEVQPFTTIPAGIGTGSLRQIAFAPHGWGAYSRHLFVSISAGEVAVVNQDGVVVGKISGFIAPRGLHFTEIDGEPSLLVADLGNQPAATPNGRIWKAGPEDIVPVP